MKRKKMLKKRVKISLLLFLSWMFAYQSTAQIQIYPNLNPYPQDQKIQKKRKGATILSVPVLEDFSTTQGIHPDNCVWESGGGVFINNTYPVGPPSYNVATLDGNTASRDLFDGGDGNDLLLGNDGQDEVDGDARTAD